MKLYYTPGACSLAAHILLWEAGAPFEVESVDLGTKTTASGADFTAINPKGYVPALLLDDGALVTENIAILDYLAPLTGFGLDGPLGRTRLLETLAYISTELHKSFKPFWHNGTAEAKIAAGEYIIRRMQFLADRLSGAYLLGDRPTAADVYLFVIMLWSRKLGVAIPEDLRALADRLEQRPGVRSALVAEGLFVPAEA